jgi:hypothetical protein
MPVELTIDLTIKRFLRKLRGSASIDDISVAQPTFFPRLLTARQTLEQCAGRPPPLTQSSARPKLLYVGVLDILNIALALEHPLHAARLGAPAIRPTLTLSSRLKPLSTFKLPFPSIDPKVIQIRQMPITELIPKDQEALRQKILDNPSDPSIPEYVKAHVSKRRGAKETP